MRATAYVLIAALIAVVVGATASAAQFDTPASLYRQTAVVAPLPLVTDDQREVIAPPPDVDRNMAIDPPPTGARMPVIAPPASSGGRFGIER